MVLITHPQNEWSNRDNWKYLLSYYFLPLGKINMFSSAYPVEPNPKQIYALLFLLQKKADDV